MSNNVIFDYYNTMIDAKLYIFDIKKILRNCVFYAKTYMPQNYL